MQIAAPRPLQRSFELPLSSVFALELLLAGVLLFAVAI